jgi:tetratricopeptide (TPR) repeat protein
MADRKYGADADSGEIVIAKARDFWSRNGRMLTIASILVILVAGGWYAYKNFYKAPKETKAAEMMFRAEDYYRKDSANKALNGDGQYWGFLRVIKDYKGTDAANLAHYYAGSCYIKLNDNQKALTYLGKFSTRSKPLQARAYKLMADAYADLGKYKEALEYYQKAAHHFDKDEPFSADCLFMAGYLAQKTLNDTKTAIRLFKEIKEKYPRTQPGYDADNYLAQMGVYDTEN